MVTSKSRKKGIGECGGVWGARETFIFRFFSQIDHVPVASTYLPTAAKQPCAGIHN